MPWAARGAAFPPSRTCGPMAGDCLWPSKLLQGNAMNPPALRASSKRCASLNRGAGLAAAQSAWPETKAIVTLAFGLRRHRIEAVIPQRKDPRASQRGRPLKFDRDAYRQRNVVERCIGWLKENRRAGAL